MKKRSDEKPDWQDQRNKIIGLGESSLRKSYYPELKEKMLDLEKRNEELNAAYEELTATEEELKANYDELSKREHELRESEEKYRTLMDNTFDGVVIHQNKVIVYANKTAAILMGCTGANPAELIGRPAFEVIHSDDRSAVITRASTALSAVQLPQHEKFVRGDGTTIDVDVVASPTVWERAPAVQVAFRDISAQKQAEAALHESEERYRTLVETTDTGFVIIDTRGNVVDANQKYVRLSGHNKLAEIIGHNVEEWTAGYEREKNIRAVGGCAKDGFVRNLEIDYVDASGQVTPVEINAATVPYGNSLRILALCRDITERRKAERALRDSEAFYRTTFNTTGSASIIIDSNTTITRVNEEFARLSGYLVEELEGNHRWTEFVAPEDLARLKKSHFQRREKGEGGAPRRYEFRFIDRNGVVKYCINHVAMIPGTSLSIASIIDISDRIFAEQALRSAKTHFKAIFEGSPDLIFVHAADGHIIDVNDNVLQAFGFTREEALSSAADKSSGNGYTMEMAMAYLRMALEQGQAEFTWVSKKKTGEEFPTEVRLRRIEAINEHGEPELRILAIVRDITERQMAERALEQARKKLGLLNTVIFQDIQSTIFALSAYLQLANSNRDETKTKSYAEKEAFLIHKIVTALDFARNYQDMGINPPRWQNVNQVFLYAISHLDSLKVSRNIKVGSLEIYADPLLEKVFFNLVENVFLHGQQATEISLSYEERGGGLTLVLQDNGVGIPSEEKQKIFERGYGKNTGLGLFLVREILSISGITIQETGTIGKGALFEMNVPKNAYRFTAVK